MARPPRRPLVRLVLLPISGESRRPSVGPSAPRCAVSARRDRPIRPPPVRSPRVPPNHSRRFRRHPRDETGPDGVGVPATHPEAANSPPAHPPPSIRPGRGGRRRPAVPRRPARSWPDRTCPNPASALSRRLCPAVDLRVEPAVTAARTGRLGWGPSRPEALRLLRCGSRGPPAAKTSSPGPTHRSPRLRVLRRRNLAYRRHRPRTFSAALIPGLVPARLTCSGEGPSRRCRPPPPRYRCRRSHRRRSPSGRPRSASGRPRGPTGPGARIFRPSQG
jgi:hypothetical protein